MINTNFYQKDMNLLFKTLAWAIYKELVIMNIRSWVILVIIK